MQIELQFSSSGENFLPFDYQYELASALYRTLTARAPTLAKELHDGAHRSRIKLFVFPPSTANRNRNRQNCRTDAAA